jgi:hypothetical protein
MELAFLSLIDFAPHVNRQDFEEYLKQLATMLPEPVKSPAQTTGKQQNGLKKVKSYSSLTSKFSECDLSEYNYDLETNPTGEDIFSRKTDDMLTSASFDVLGDCGDADNFFNIQQDAHSSLELNL